MTSTLDQSQLSIDPLSTDNDKKARAQELVAAAKRLLGEGDLTERLDEAFKRWQSDVQKIAEGAAGPLSIAVIGGKNVGKSTVIRSLVNDPEIRKQIPCGILPTEGTKQLIWIGPEVRASPNLDKEILLPTSSKDLVDLGRQYTLLDVPGTDDDGKGLFDLARDAVLSAPVKLFVVSDKERGAVSVHSWSRMIHKGSRVLTLVVGSGSEPHEEGKLRAWHKRSDAILGEASLADTVWVPYVQDASREDSLMKIRDSVVPTLSKLLQSVGDPKLLARERSLVCWRRFQNEVAQILKPLREGLGDSFHDWQSKRDSVLRKAICNLLGDREVAEATLKMDWRLRMIGRLHSLYFPQKAALTLLTIMGGKWDRLTMGAMGSAPSFLLAVAGGIGNLRRHRQMKGEISRKFSRRLENHSREMLTEAARELENRLDRSCRDSCGKANEKRLKNLSFDWEGVEELKDWFHEHLTKKMELSVATCSQASLHIYGLFGTGLFWAFLFGPLFALYSTFFAAWGSTDLTQFPGHGWGTLGMGLLLAIIPLGLLAMTQLLIRPGNQQMGQIYDELSDEFGREVRRRSEDGRLRLKLNHPRLDDLGRIVAWLNN